MSKFPDRPQRALLVIDVQVGVVTGAFERDRVVANIAALVDRARAAAVPVIWVQHEEPEMPIGSAYWQLAPELAPRAGEPRIDKRYRSSFEDTRLDGVLAELRVGELVVCGAQTNFCVRHTIHAALERGYDVTLVADAHTTSDEETPGGVVRAAMTVAEQNRGCAEYALPGRSCRITTTAAAFAG